MILQKNLKMTVKLFLKLLKFVKFFFFVTAMTHKIYEYEKIVVTSTFTKNKPSLITLSIQNIVNKIIMSMGSSSYINLSIILQLSCRQITKVRHVTVNNPEESMYSKIREFCKKLKKITYVCAICALKNKSRIY